MSTGGMNAPAVSDSSRPEPYCCSSNRRLMRFCRADNSRKGSQRVNTVMIRNLHRDRNLVVYQQPLLSLMPNLAYWKHKILVYYCQVNIGRMLPSAKLNRYKLRLFNDLSDYAFQVAGFRDSLQHRMIPGCTPRFEGS